LELTFIVEQAEAHLHIQTAQKTSKLVINFHPTLKPAELVSSARSACCVGL
jgi:hypothetical protein